MKVSIFVVLLLTLVTSVVRAEEETYTPPPGTEIVSVSKKGKCGKITEIHTRKIVTPAPTPPVAAPVEEEAPKISLPRKKGRTHVTTCDWCEAPDNVVFSHRGECDEDCADARVEHNREFHRPRRQVQQEYCEPAPRRRSGFRLSIGGGRRVRRPQGRVVYNTAPRMVRRSGGRVYLPPTRRPIPIVRPPVFVGGRNGSNGSTVVVGGSGRNGNSGSSFGTGQSGRFGSSGNPYGARGANCLRGWATQVSLYRPKPTLRSGPFQFLGKAQS